MIANLSSMNTNVINKVAHLVYTGTVVKGMRVAGVVHEACNVAGGVRRLQELGLYVHLVELHREGRSAVTRAKSVRGVRAKDPRGSAATYDQVLLLVTDLHCVYGVGGEGTAGASLTLQKRQKSVRGARGRRWTGSRGAAAFSGQ